MRISSEVLHHFIPLFLRDGWQVVSVDVLLANYRWNYLQNVHAIGDRANGIVLDAFEASLKGINISASRPRLEHAQIISATDRERLGRLGGTCSSLTERVTSSSPNTIVIASIQPTHACVQNM
jgi:hypothetical protein